MAELESTLTNSELTEWLAYNRIEPFGSEMEDYRAGIVASTIANVNRSKGQKAFTPKDFMPFAEKEKSSVSQDVIKLFSELGK